VPQSEALVVWSSGSWVKAPSLAPGIIFSANYQLVDYGKINYLIDGLSGTGKSTILEELTRRGYHAISSDRVWAYSADPETGLPGGPRHHDNFMWDKTKAIPALESNDPDVLLCAVVVVTAMSSGHISVKSSTLRLTTTLCADDWMNVPTTILAKSQKRSS
jgi:hypothetical protein